MVRQSSVIAQPATERAGCGGLGVGGVAVGWVGNCTICSVQVFLEKNSLTCYPAPDVPFSKCIPSE